MPVFFEAEAAPGRLETRLLSDMFQVAATKLSVCVQAPLRATWFCGFAWFGVFRVPFPSITWKEEANQGAQCQQLLCF